MVSKMKLRRAISNGKKSRVPFGIEGFCDIVMIFATKVMKLGFGANILRAEMTN